MSSKKELKKKDDERKKREEKVMRKDTKKLKEGEPVVFYGRIYKRKPKK
jgi:hypothetical protein